MMRNECNIIRDILPLYAENMVSGDTADLVEEHLKDCDACRKEYENTKEIQPEREVTDAAPLLKLSRKMKIKSLRKRKRKKAAVFQLWDFRSTKQCLN